MTHKLWRPAVALVCAYEVVAIVDGRIPTVTAICHKWIPLAFGLAGLGVYHLVVEALIARRRIAIAIVEIPTQ